MWSSARGNYDWNRLKVTAGDVDNDGKTELATFYNYGGATTSIFVHDPDNSYTPQLKWYSGPGNFDWNLAKLTSADVDGDGRTELVIFYNYGNANTAIFTFDPDNNYAPQLKWTSGWGNFDWSRAKVTSADVDGDGRTELATYYNYGSANTGIFVFDPDGNYVPQLKWSSGWGNFDWSYINIASGDVDSDGKGELISFYDYSP
ncbi:MAG: VCBS repeat-containing protein [Actinomycetota bacterium]